MTRNRAAIPSALLGGAFQQAMKWGWATRNVCDSRPLRLCPVNPERSSPRGGCISCYTRCSRESEPAENHVAFRLLAATGARRGEVCGLRWSSVDLDQRTI